jgi:hypothetical protein
MVPVFVVLYILTVPAGPWKAVVVTELLAIVLIAYAGYSYVRAFISVDGEGITERGFFGGTRRVPVGEIGSIVRAETFDASSRATVPQLFVRGRDGRQLVRMRGQFWSRESMDQLVAVLGIRPEALPEAMSQSELRAHQPSMLYWFERRPVIAVIAFAVIGAAIGAGIWGLFRVFPA